MKTKVTGEKKINLNKPFFEYRIEFNYRGERVFQEGGGLRLRK